MNLRLIGAAAAVAAVIGSVAVMRAQTSPQMSFFITSVGAGDGANLGGLAGADRHCTALAEAAGVRGKTWRAYLSAAAANGQPAVHAKDRIGRGPWFNAKGEKVAENVADLHSENNKLGKQGSLNEKAGIVNGRGDTPNTHDMMTGSNADGTLATGGLPNGAPCGNWTSNATDGVARLGHFDKQGGGDNPNSWNSAHNSRGCSQANLVATGGAGLYYCFATN
jgi:hypothetical protein